MYNAFAPIYAERMVGADGRVMVGRGQIAQGEDLSLLRFPDPHDDELYAPAKEFLAHKGEFATCGAIRLGIGATLYSMGVDNFTYAVLDNPGFAEEVLQRYVDWNVVVMQRLQELGFDYLWAFDDFAADSGPLVSLRVYREFVLPRLAKAVAVIDVPWVAHTDGNFMPLVQEWLSLGMSAIHPIQPDVVDIYEVKRLVGDRVALVGNIDMQLMAAGSPEEVREQVKERIQRLAPGGGYLISSSNSITDYLREENVWAMVEAVNRYRWRPYDGTAVPG
jgi:uroporphyrinogen decarboxylase